MTTLAERLSAAAEALAGVTETPRLDAEILLSHALGLSRSGLLARLQESPDAPEFDAFVERRRRSEPIAYVTGRWEFFSLEFLVKPPVLVPRPETEHLVEAVVEYVNDRPCRVLDLGTGTGCVGISVAHTAPKCRVVATDINRDALDLARQNARMLGVVYRMDFRRGAFFDPLPDGEAPFDVVCSNPPYVEHGAWPHLPPSIRLYEDPAALLAGEDGLDCIRTLVSGAPQRLAAGGLLAFEIGMGQYEAVERLLADAGYKDIRFLEDLGGVPRVAMGLMTL